MSFKYYIVDSASGNISGTDDKDVATSVSYDGDCYVIDVENNSWIVDSSTEPVEIGEYEAEDDDEDE
jgi:hypothetical protein